MQALVVCLTVFRNKCTFPQLSVILAWVKLVAQCFVILPYDHQPCKSSFPFHVLSVGNLSLSAVFPYSAYPRMSLCFIRCFRTILCCGGGLRGGICPVIWVKDLFPVQYVQSSYCNIMQTLANWNV